MYWIKNFQWTSIKETNCLVLWIEIYPADKVIHLWNNWVLDVKQRVANLCIFTLSIRICYVFGNFFPTARTLIGFFEVK